MVSRVVRPCLIGLLLGSLLALSACTRNDPALLERIDALETRLARQEDVEAIRRLAYSYGYFMDNASHPNRARHRRCRARSS